MVQHSISGVPKEKAKAGGAERILEELRVFPKLAKDKTAQSRSQVNPKQNKPKETD
jgi:hypothetical protein